MKKIFSLLCVLVFLFVCIISVALPKEITRFASAALDICLTQVIPSLFPFMVISRILSESNVCKYSGYLLGGLIRTIFGVDKNLGGAFLCGIFGGFPSGAIATGVAYQKGECTKQQAEFTLALCNNSSVSFILSFAGICVLGSLKSGIILLLSQLLSIFIISLIMRIVFKFKTEMLKHPICVYKTKNSLKNIIISSVTKSVTGILNVCGYIIVFYILSELIAKLFGNRFDLIYITKCFFEMTGAVKMCETPDFPLNLILCSSAIGFSGICVIMQVSGICEEYGLSPKYFVLSRILSALVMPVCTLILLTILPREAIYVFNTQMSDYNNTNFKAVTLIYALVFALVMCIMGVFYFLAERFKKKSENYK